MEYLSRCLDELYLNLDLKFHPKCEKLNLTHMMFGDDLLLFARANASLVSKIVAAFHKFSHALP